MTDPADLKGVARLYEDSLRKHGTVAKGVGWRDDSSHRLRFDKLVEVIQPSGESVTVNDLGCGYGAFYKYLNERGYKLTLFHGYDVSEDMLAEARQRIQSHNVKFVLGSRLEQAADYSFASGIFNVRLTATDNDWLKHILTTLDNMHEKSQCGFAFNLLTAYVDWRDDKLFYGDPAFFFDHCKRRYSKYVSLLHDYPLWEWTILVRK